MHIIHGASHFEPNTSTSNLHSSPLLSLNRVFEFSPLKCVLRKTETRQRTVRRTVLGRMTVVLRAPYKTEQRESQLLPAREQSIPEGKKSTDVDSPTIVTLRYFVIVKGMVSDFYFNSTYASSSQTRALISHSNNETHVGLAGKNEFSCIHGFVRFLFLHFTCSPRCERRPKGGRRSC